MSVILEKVGEKKDITFNVTIGYGEDYDNMEVYYVEKDYHDVYVNDDEFMEHSDNRKQLMVVDIGCPRSLLGRKEYERFFKSLSPSERRRIKETRTAEKF